MLSFSLFLHSSTLSFYFCQSPVRYAFAPFACFQAPCCLPDICVVVSVLFEQMSLPSVLSSDRLFHIFSRKRTDSDLHTAERKLDSDWCRPTRRQEPRQRWNRGFLIDILCCARSSAVGVHCLHLCCAAQKYKNITFSLNLESFSCSDQPFGQQRSLQFPECSLILQALLFSVASPLISPTVGSASTHLLCARWCIC